jgi:predicted MFS family arabinose efflux permease
VDRRIAVCRKVPLQVTNQTVSAKGNWLALAFLAGFGVLAGQGFSRFSFGLLFPRMGVSLVGTTSNASYLAALYAASYLVGVAALIYVTRHVAPIRLLVMGVALSTLGLFTIGLAHTGSVVVVGLIVAGLGAALTYVPALSFVGAAVEGLNRHRATGLAGAGIGVGIITARFLALLFHSESTASGWRDVWISEGMIGLVVSIVILIYALRFPSSVADRGESVASIFQLPHWLPLGLAYLCFGAAYSIYSNLAVKGWELAGLSASSAANSLLLVAPAQISGGFLMLALSRRIGVRRGTQISFVMLALALGEESIRTKTVILPMISAVLLGLVGAGITAQFVLVVRSQLEKQPSLRDATTTVFGVITLMYAVGGLGGLLAASTLTQGHSGVVSTFLVGAFVAIVGGMFARFGVVDD